VTDELRRKTGNDEIEISSSPYVGHYLKFIDAPRTRIAIDSTDFFELFRLPLHLNGTEFEIDSNGTWATIPTRDFSLIQPVRLEKPVIIRRREFNAEWDSDSPNVVDGSSAEDQHRRSRLLEEERALQAASDAERADAERVLQYMKQRASAYEEPTGVAVPEHVTFRHPDLLMHNLNSQMHARFTNSQSRLDLHPRKKHLTLYGEPGDRFTLSGATFFFHMGIPQHFHNKPLTIPEQGKIVLSKRALLPSVAIRLSEPLTIKYERMKSHIRQRLKEERMKKAEAAKAAAAAAVSEDDDVINSSESEAERQKTSGEDTGAVVIDTTAETALPTLLPEAKEEEEDNTTMVAAVVSTTAPAAETASHQEEEEESMSSSETTTTTAAAAESPLLPNANTLTAAPSQTEKMMDVDDDDDAAVDSTDQDPNENRTSNRDFAASKVYDDDEDATPAAAPLFPPEVGMPQALAFHKFVDGQPVHEPSINPLTAESIASAKDLQLKVIELGANASGRRHESIEKLFESLNERGKFPRFRYDRERNKLSVRAGPLDMIEFSAASSDLLRSIGMPARYIGRPMQTLNGVLEVPFVSIGSRTHTGPINVDDGQGGISIVYHSFRNRERQAIADAAADDDDNDEEEEGTKTSESGMETVTLRLRGGHYRSAQDLVEAIRQAIRKRVYMQGWFNFALLPNDSLRIRISDKDFTIRFEPELERMLGIRRRKVNNNDDVEAAVSWIDFPGTTQVGAGIEMSGGLNFLMLYSDVGEMVRIGDRSGRILRCVNIGGLGRLIDGGGGDQESVAYHFPNIYYVPVARSRIDSVGIALHSDFGTLIRFTKGKTLVVLHFRRRHST
jgi:hypothetical protein